MGTRATFLVICTITIVTVVAEEKVNTNFDSIMDDMVKGTKPGPVTEKESEQETCFTSKGLIEFIENIRKGELRINRFFGSYKCVGKRLNKTEPLRSFSGGHKYVRCFDSLLVINTVIECANLALWMGNGADDRLHGR